MRVWFRDVNLFGCAAKQWTSRLSLKPRNTLPTRIPQPEKKKKFVYVLEAREEMLGIPPSEQYCVEWRYSTTGK